MEIKWLGGVIRGIAYKLQCVQDSGQDQADTSASDVITTNTENMVVKNSIRTEEYQPPFTRLPYGVRHCLKDHEMTTFRRLAIVKLWERTAITKIAVKRGVENTRNERMAEELKGALLSRNKEFIVFYRGNDFLPPVVTNPLKEMQKSRNLRQEEEEEARGRALALVGSN
ncbi:hypothetical protein Golax_025642, partial [Gossypium laxum]|nr:hypothetical protein [Gossypium laxum]